VRWLLTIAMLDGCWKIEEADDRRNCDRALAIVCSCPSIECATAPPPIVDLLRRCNGDELRRSEFDVSICIQDSRSYCSILGGLATGDPSTCAMRCDQQSACDKEAACHEFQYARCGAP
jgi:hypothetical protein